MKPTRHRHRYRFVGDKGLTTIGWRPGLEDGDGIEFQSDKRKHNHRDTEDLRFKGKGDNVDAMGDNVGKDVYKYNIGEDEEFDINNEDDDTQ